MLSLRTWKPGEFKTVVAFAITLLAVLILYVPPYVSVPSVEGKVTVIGTMASLGGVWIALYVAYWAYYIEREKKKEQQDQNEHYKLNLLEELSGLVTTIEMTLLGLKTLDRAEGITKEERAIRWQQHRDNILAWTSDLQMTNLNPHAPAEIKTKVKLIIRQAPKVMYADSVAEDVFERIREILAFEYMNEIENPVAVKFRDRLNEKLNTKKEVQPTGSE